MVLHHTSICRNWYAEQFPLSAGEFQLSEYRWNEFLDTVWISAGIEKKQGIYTHMQFEAHVPWFRIVFEMTDGSLMEFQMQQGDFRELEKGDQGMLTYQGNRYICYQKYKFKSEAQEEEKC